MSNIGFVSTSVLESKDGIEFNEEVRIESEEVKEAERIAKEAESKPLWQQLAAKREEEEAKFNAVRASLFAPPRPLDEEESNFLQGVEAQRLEAKQRKEKWEAQELRGFAIARANQTVVVAEPKKPKPKPSADGAGDKGKQDQGATGTAPPPPVVAVKIKGKRKHKDKEQKAAKRKAPAMEAEAAAGEGKAGSRSKSKSKGKGEPVPSPRIPGAEASSLGDQQQARAGNGGNAGGAASVAGKDDKGLSSLLGGYGSDSGSDSGSDGSGD